MAITETLNEGLKRGYTIKVTAAELDATVNAKLTEAQPNIELKGFRKGKVPMAMLKKQHGPALLGEAMQETVDGEMNSHLEKSGDKPAGQPEMKMTNENWKDGDDVEYKARDAANIAWINKGFEKAATDGSVGVIVVVQASMDWEGYARDAAAPNNEFTAAFAAVKQALLTNTLKFKKPVLLQNGDEHWYQVDMPMNETAGKLVERDKGSLVENFTRVQTFGSGFNHWVELIIDPRAENLWTFKVHIIKENLDVHTAP